MIITRTLAAATVAQLLATTAWAQIALPPTQNPVPSGTTPDAAAAGAAPADADVGADIVITAQKRSERLQDVPITVDVLSSDKLANSSIKNLQDINAVVPGLTVNVPAAGAFVPSLRGITVSSNVVENATSLYIDGVYMVNQREGLRDLNDIDQITVLKGPQGTLFGRNATAGVIQITTHAPSFTTQGAFNFGYDNYETVRTSGYLTGGLTDKVAASVSASYSTQGKGFGQSLTAGFPTNEVKHNISARSKILFEPDDKTKITFIGDYLNREDTGIQYAPYPGTSFTYPGFGPTNSRYDTYAGTPGYNRFESVGASLQIDHDMDFARLVSIFSYRHGNGGFRFDVSSVTPSREVSVAKLVNEDYTQEFQLISPNTGRFQWVTGLFYLHNKIGYNPFDIYFLAPPFIPTVGPLAGVTDVNRTAFETTESVAPFAQVDYELFKDTKLTLGGRWTYEQRSIAGTFNYLLPDGTVRLSQPATSIRTLTLEKPSWRIALDHKFTPDISVYASYNRGIKSGGYNIAAPTTAPFLPEQLDAYEVGFKSQLFDRKLTFNTSAFLYNYENIQISTYATGNTVLTVTNGGRAKLYGLDADFQARVTPELSLNGGLEALHATFTNYPNAPYLTILPGGGSATPPRDASGNRLPFSQEFVGTLALDYDRPVGRVNTHFNVTGTYNSDYYLQADNVLRQPAYVMLNSSFRVSDRTNKLSLTFAVTNILDEAIITTAFAQASQVLVSYGYAPRVYSLTAGFRF